MLLEKIKKNLPTLVFILFLSIGLAIYANSFGNRLFWDDQDLIINNTYVHNFQIGRFFSENEIAGAYGQVSNYWRPLLLISFAIDYQFWGLAPFGYHLDNTLLHILAAWLVFIFLSLFLSLRITAPAAPLEKQGRAAEFFLAFLPALFFLIHPLNTEAVTYVAGRGDPLSAVFILTALIFYLVFRSENKRKFLGYSLICFIAALLVKETVIIFPALILLLEIFFAGVKIFPERRPIKAMVLRLAPFAAVSAIYAVLRIFVLNFNHILAGAQIAVKGSYGENIFVRLFTFASVMLLNFKLLFLPVGLVMQRDIMPVLHFFSWPVLIFLALIGFILWLAWRAWRTEPLIAFGLGWFFILLLPRTNILKINLPMYEHWLYLPMIGFWLAFFSFLRLLLRERNSPAAPSLQRRGMILPRRFVYGIIILYCIFLAILTIERNRDWRDPITFYEKNLLATPDNFIEHNNLGMAYDDAGRYSEAVAQYEKAIAESDIYPQVHYDLANSLVAVKQYDRAEKEYLQTIKMDPHFGSAYQNLYNLYIYLGEKDEASSLLNSEKK